MKKKRGCLFISLGILILLLIGFDLTCAVKPELPEIREGKPVPSRPATDDEPFHIEPIAPTFYDRVSSYLDWLLPRETPDERGGVWMDIGKLEAGALEINPGSFQAALDFVNEREDPSDFYMTALIRLYYLNIGNGKLTLDQERAIEDAILNYKYWLDEPNTSFVEMWTENHQILSASAEFLAGQIFPNSIFTNDGLTGQEKMRKAKTRALEWIDLRSKIGFSEWDSETYYPEDLAPLINFVDFSEDEELSIKAAMMVDLILFDFAVDTFYGQYATSHGRVTASSIKSAAGGSMTTIAALAWGQGRFQSTSNMGVIALATTKNYQVPQVISSIGLDNPEIYSNFERHSIPLASTSDFGFDLEQVEDAPKFWGLGAFTTPEIINLTIQTADTWNLWHYPDFRSLKDIAKVLQQLNALPIATRLLDPDPNGILMTEVNKVTYRTPDYMLSNAQDFRKGEKGYQQHIWQATLSPYAVVFVNNPDSLRGDDKHRPSYWMGNGRQPRTAQVENVLISLFDIPRYPSAPPPLEARHYAFTHAYFPIWAFDEVIERGGWIFGRVNDGYIALYSSRPYEWVEEGPDSHQEVIALGRKNVWICQLGRRSLDGSFEDFVTAVASANLQIRGLSVKYSAPRLGELSFDWDDPLLLNGETIELNDYPRWSNPYTEVHFGSQAFTIEHNGERLMLDFINSIRKIEP